MDSLKQSRDQLLNLTKNLLELIVSRRELVRDIQCIKSSEEFSIPCFDPTREVELFDAIYEQFPSLTTRELLALSLLIEEHASKNCDYPQWSNCEHLEVSSHRVYEMINPGLLKKYAPDSLRQLKLNQFFQKVFVSQ